MPHCVRLQASTQARSMHLSVRGHSRSLLQPARKKGSCYRWCCSYRLCWILTQDACCVGVSFQRGRTDAGGSVVVDPADSLDAALLPLGDARVPAFLPDACKVDGTLGVRGAFRWDCYKRMHLIDY